MIDCNILSSMQERECVVPVDNSFYVLYVLVTNVYDIVYRAHGCMYIFVGVCGECSRGESSRDLDHCPEGFHHTDMLVAAPYKAGGLRHMGTCPACN